MNILVRGNRSSGKSGTDSPEHWKPPNASLLALAFIQAVYLKH